MTTADAKKALKRWACFNEVCKELNREVSEMKALLDAAAGISGAKYDDMPKGTDISDPTGASAVKVAELRRQYNALLDSANERIEREIAFKRRVEAALDKLPDDYKKTLICRYQRRMNYVKTGFEIGVSDRTVQRYEKKALLLMSMIL